MSQSPRAGFRGPQHTGSRTSITETETVETLLGALEDADCREIMAVTTDEALSANEVSEKCDLPLSTAYRKLEILTDSGLVEEKLRLSRSGKHTNEYIRSIEEITVSVDGQIELEVSHTQAGESANSVFAGAD